MPQNNQEYSNKTNFVLNGVLKWDPLYNTFTRNGAECAVCNLTVIYPRSKKKPEFEFVTFNSDLALYVAKNFRKDDRIVITSSTPYPCRDRDKEGNYRNKLKWQFYAIEDYVLGDDESFVAGGEVYTPEGDDHQGQPSFDDEPPI